MIENSVSTDTICSISTPIGMGGIGIIRMSGPKALDVAEKVFVGSKNQDLNSCTGYSIRYGKIVHRGELIDEVLLTVMRSPKTYTREDVVEINCHSGTLVLRKILTALISLGVRLAEPGEFTRRAFLNGRIDLSQAEAVMTLISAKSEGALRSALRQLGGELSDQIHKIKSKIVQLLSEVEASIDFPEEDLERIEHGEIQRQVSEIVDGLEKLIQSSRRGRILSEGVLTVIVGRTNVGKSSLLNRFLMEDRAIVTSVPGTTRDVIDAEVTIEGVPFRLVDTAGIRESSDPVEREGVLRSRKCIENADLVLMVVDLSRDACDEDFEIVRILDGKDTILILNKTDCVRNLIEEKEKYSLLIKELKPKSIYYTSIFNEKSINDLKIGVSNLIVQGVGGFNESVVVTSLRHKAVLVSARDAMKRVSESIKQGLSEEFLSIDLRSALLALGRITGETTTEEILDEIFKHFCVGK